MTQRGKGKPGGASGPPPGAGASAGRTDPGGQTRVGAPPGWVIVLAGLLLALAVWSVFGQTRHHDFVNLDDDFFITSNVHVQGGLNWEAVKWAFRLYGGDYWHPLTWLSLMLDASLFGQAAGGFHFTNVALHAANSVLVFLLLRMLTGALWRSAVVAALFALHPLRVESVAWVTERKDVLSGCFGLLALIFYARYAQCRTQNAECRMQKPATSDPQPATRNPRSTLHASPFTHPRSTSSPYSSLACGLMSKAMLVTWPFVMLLLDYWPLQRLRAALTSRILRSQASPFTFTLHPGCLRSSRSLF